MSGPETRYLEAFTSRAMPKRTLGGAGEEEVSVMSGPGCNGWPMVFSEKRHAKKDIQYTRYRSDNVQISYARLYNLSCSKAASPRRP